MPQSTGRPSALARGFGRFVDAIAKGNNYNPQTGQYSNVARGLLARAAQVGATAVGGPLLGQLVGQGGTNWVNTGNPLNFNGNDSRIGQLVNAFMENGSGVGPVTRQIPLQSMGLSIPNLSGGGFTPTPAISTSEPWSGIGSQGGLGGTNPFGGSYGGNTGGVTATPGHSYAGRSGFVSSSPYMGVLTGQAARDFAAGMRGPSLTKRLAEMY